MQPHDFPRHARGDKLRFHARTYNGGKYQVYGVGLQHVCECETREMAEMIAAALESVADAHERTANTITDDLLSRLRPAFMDGYSLAIVVSDSGEKWFVGNGVVCCGYHDTPRDALRVAVETLVPDPS